MLFDSVRIKTPFLSILQLGMLPQVDIANKLTALLHPGMNPADPKYAAAAAALQAQQQSLHHHRDRSPPRNAGGMDYPRPPYQPANGAHYTAADAARAARFAAAAQQHQQLQLVEQSRLYARQFYDRVRAAQHMAALSAGQSVHGEAGGLQRPDGPGVASGISPPDPYRSRPAIARGTALPSSRGGRKRNNPEAHLSGEMIRRLWEQKKMKLSNGTAVPTSTTTSTTLARSESMYFPPIPPFFLMFSR